MNILGISAFYHDSAACLIRDGEIIAAAQEERFTRKKHDDAFPKNAVDFCLKEGNISLKDVNHVGFYDKPFLKFERLLLTYLSYAPAGIKSFLKSMPVWLNQKIFLKDYLANELNYDGDIIFTEHHESHAASAFFPSPFKKSAILTMDGVGEWATTSYGLGENNQIKLLGEINFPHSIGLLYSAFTYHLGFRVNSGEYKVMGLAPYGEPKYVDLIKKNLIDIKSDGSFRLNMEYFDYCVGLTMTNARFDQLFGFSRRDPETELKQHHMDMARSVQEVTEEVMLKMAQHVYSETKQENLCLAGGVALNCVGNGKILKKGPFKNIWIQPAAGDAGGALGVASFIWYQYLENKREVNGTDDLQKGSYLGPRFDDEEIEKFLLQERLPYTRINPDDLPQKVAHLINNQKVIGLVVGKMEFGPRALGARSIIGDARSEKMQSLINLKIKFRESFRPFAPSVLKNKVSEYFDFNASSPYMLMVADVQKDKINAESRTRSAEGIEKLKICRSIIPAVTHVDYSARIQTVDENTNPLFYKIIKEFDQLTGCPVIINTSFNVRGEPIVCTPQDAYRCFMCTDLDYLVLENFILDKNLQPKSDQYKKENMSLVLD
ncbi:MAG: carbamoyltransferase [Candidatus Omnitrophica bacterium]|nr:carbamoyltransferase [Candidatus Omnitrophota bacterium]